MTVFTQDEAITFIDKLLEIIHLIDQEKVRRIEEFKKMVNADEEDAKSHSLDLARLYKGVFHIMEINSALMQIQGHQISEHINKTLLPFYA